MLYILMDFQMVLPVYMNIVARVILSPLTFKLTAELKTKFLDPEILVRKKNMIAEKLTEV